MSRSGTPALPLHNHAQTAANGLAPAASDSPRPKASPSVSLAVDIPLLRCTQQLGANLLIESCR